ncbi:MAG: carbonic anhydrase [Gammaproteobacteria bacterium]|nr:carbonic anhydrase [Gammaproteobacteria bacterium]
MDAIEKLILGYANFCKDYYKKNQSYLKELAREGQHPKVAVIACSDSRVDPAVITDSTPGELFVIRNVANIVPPCEMGGTWHGTSAALDFAVCTLEVEHIIVFGHSQCGGIQALLKAGPNDAVPGRFVVAWMRIMEEVRNKVLAAPELQTPDERARACEEGAIAISLKNLMTFPWVQERARRGKLQLHGWYYDLESGDLLSLDPRSRTFKPIM